MAKRKKKAGKPERKTPGKGKGRANSLLLIAVIAAVAVVMALRGCPRHYGRPRGNWQGGHYSRRERRSPDSGTLADAAPFIPIFDFYLIDFNKPPRRRDGGVLKI